MKKCCLMAIVLGMSCFNMSGWAMADCDEKPSCGDLGYIAEYDECTNGDARKLDCPFDGYGYFCKSPDNGTNCVLGSTLYDDLKCYASSEVPAGRVPIGKVTNPFKTLAMALDETELPYGAVGVTQEVFTSRVTDKEKTKALVEEVGDSSDYAAGYCYNYKTKGTNKGDWFLSYRMFSANRFSTTGTTWKGFAWITGIDGSGKEYWGIDMTDSEGAFVSYKEGMGVRRDRTELHSVRCLINYTDVVVLTPKTCEIGDVVYDDLKCYTLEPEGRTAIGIAVDPSQRLMLGLNGFDSAPMVDGTLSWQGFNQNSLRMRKVLDVNEDLQQKACTEYEVRAGTCSTDAKAVTAMFASEDAILEWLKPIVEEKYGAMGNFKFTDFDNGAPDYCWNYSTAGTSKGDWFIPAADTWIKVFENYDLIESVLTAVGGTKIRDSKYSRSTSYWSTTVTKMPEKETDNVDYGFFAVSMNYENKYINLKEIQPDSWVYAVYARCVARY